MARILLGVSGGIAAYKALELVRLLTAAGHATRAIQTPTSTRFVGEASFSALTGAPVLTDEFQEDPARGAFPGQEPPAHRPLSHLQLVANADLFVIAPASANTIAKLAHGLADNLLTACALAARCPIVVAPAMNNNMYESSAVRDNLELLRARGVHVVDPEEGRLASIGEHGVGRLAEPQRLLEECERLLARGERRWSGLQVLITAGGTREPIDGVRFVGNSSSGRMGAALAQAAAAQGAEVTLIAANLSVPAPQGVKTVAVRTAAEMMSACEERFESCDVLLMAAAVADFRPVRPFDGKLKKHGREHLSIELEPTVDILRALAQRRRSGQTLVGFAAEHGSGGEREAARKLAEKGLDAVVLNDVSRADIGFESALNEVTILTASGARRIAKAPKNAIADAILDATVELRIGT
jgi:phosphopantothenoylcysteine decarboxylase / phosphopantothenate---cysteine ligase